MKSASRTNNATAHVAAVVVTALVVLAFTVGKAFVSIPGLWSAEAHQLSQVRLNPLETFEHARVWWGPWLNLFGNTAGAALGAGVAGGTSKSNRATVLWSIAAAGAVVLTVWAALGLSA